MANSSDSGSKTPTAPYVSYRTFRNWIEGLRHDSLPRTIDSSLMSNLSGAVQSQLRPALRYLQLVDDENRPLDRLAQLINARDEERSGVLMEILNESYGFFVGEDGVIDLSRETPNTFSAKLRETGLNGESVRRAESFFIQIAADAGISIPKRLTAGRAGGERRKSTGTSRPTKSTRKEKASSTVNESPKYNPPPQQAEAQMTWKQKMKQSIIEKMSEKYPDFDPTWDVEVQQKWYDGWMNAMKLVDTEPEEYVNESETDD